MAILDGTIFDMSCRSNLGYRRGDGRLAVNNGVFAEKDNFTWRISSRDRHLQDSDGNIEG